MKHATFRFYGPLNAFLPEVRRQVPFRYAFWGTPSVKDAIEAQGVPHTEVSYVQVNGQPVPFAYNLHDGDAVSVYPCFAQLAPDGARTLGPPAGERPRFALDAHLGRLARSLRMLGFDTLYRNDVRDDELVELSRSENRVVLTRDRALLKRRAIGHGHYVHAQRPDDQLDEVVRRFGLRRYFEPFTRCLVCNGRLEPVDKLDVLDRLPPDTARRYDAFYRCRQCHRIYWQGSHYDAMRRRIAGL